MAATLPPKTTDAAVLDDTAHDDGRVMSASPLLAALMVGAGLIHFVMVPIHITGSQVEGAMFAAAAWAQVVLAVLLVTKNRRSVLVATAAINLVFLGVWAYARTKGLPFGAHPDVAEAIDTPDLATALMQGAAVVGAVGRLVNKGRVHIPMLAPIALGGAVLGASTMIVVSPETAAHRHSLEDTTGAASAANPIQAQLANIETDRCDKPLNPKAYWNEADKAGVDTVFGTGHLATPWSQLAAAPAAAPVSADGHAHGAAAGSTATLPDLPKPDRTREVEGGQVESKLVELSKGEGEANDARLVVELSKISDEDYDRWLGTLHENSLSHGDHNADAPDDNGGHGGHAGPNSWVAVTDPQTCTVLNQQIDLARETALKYPTVADATAAGWIKVTGYVPGIAAHYMNFSLVDDKFEVDKPEMILYDGDKPESRVVGLSYYYIKQSDNEPKVGFAGGNDHFHRHIGLCTKGTVVIGDSKTTEEECAARGGVKGQSRGGWMSHAWVVPGCESPWGIFSGANPLLDGELPKSSGQNEGGCSASSVRGRYDLAPGEKAPVAGSATPAGEVAAP